METSVCYCEMVMCVARLKFAFDGRGRAGLIELIVNGRGRNKVMKSSSKGKSSADSTGMLQL